MSDKKDRDHIEDHIIEWAPTINMHVKKLKPNLPEHIDHEDLYAAGVNGLLHAFHKYDAKKGASFGSYANRIIKGKMLDHITSGGGSSNAIDYYHYNKARKIGQQSKQDQPTQDQPTQDIKPPKPEGSEF
jgi:DNA-directed RNA polymerase specialized sigma subunit